MPSLAYHDSSATRSYARRARSHSFPLEFRHLKPFLLDFHTDAGIVGGHYFFQDLWAARKIFERRPARHVDIASRLDGFVSHVLAFMPVEVIDVRPLKSSLAGLSFVQADATTLGNYPDESIESISSLHAIEHFGLGRYSDPVDPDACFAAMRSLARVLSPGGRLYFSVPVGRERLEFNAHRIFNPHSILTSFSSLTLLSFATVDDDGNFLPNARLADYADANFACGMFEFTKDGPNG